MNQVWNRCQQEESYSSTVGILLLLQLSSCKPQWWGETNVTQCTNAEVRRLACFGNFPIERHSRIKINTRIFDRCLKLDEWAGNWNGCNGFSQEFKRFGPWVQKTMASDLDGLRWRQLFRRQLWTRWVQLYKILSKRLDVRASLYRYTAECHHGIDERIQCYCCLTSHDLWHWRRVIWREQKEVGQEQSPGVHPCNQFC